MEELLSGERPRLLRLATRMLGSSAEAEEVVQEAALRLAAQDEGEIASPAAWLTTVVGRLCLDALRAQRRRGMQVDVTAASAVPDPAPAAEDLALLAEGVGLALVVVVERLAPAERIAFVLHDLFDVPFAEVARMIGRSEAAVRQLASRARRRVRGAPPPPGRQRQYEARLVAAFHRAASEGDTEGLLALLAPDVVLLHDAAEVARGAAAVAARARVAPTLRGWTALLRVDGAPGIVGAPGGRLALVLRFGFAGDRIAAVEVVHAAAMRDRLILSVDPPG
jgi:RNA polymerase sigma factor (sigma-70 family)